MSKLALTLLFALVACQPCEEYARSVHTAAETLEPYTIMGIDHAVDAGQIVTPETAEALRALARDLTTTAAKAAGG